MRFREILPIIIIAALALNLLFILSTIKGPLNEKVTTHSVGSINLTVEQVCGDTYCNSPESCSNCANDCGVCSSNESSGAASSSSGGGGGGGAAPVEIIKEVKTGIEVSQELIKMFLKKGEISTAEFSIKNIGTDPVIILIENSENNMLSISPKALSLESNGTQKVKITVSAKETEPGIYPAEIIIKTKDIVKKVNLIIEIESEKVIFDLTLDIPPESRQLLAGEELTFNPTIFSITGELNKEIEIFYVIKDFSGNIILQETEKLTIKDQLTFLKRLKLPQDIKVGKYVIAVSVKYKESFGVTSNVFDVITIEKASVISSNKIVIGGSMIFLFLIIIISSLLYHQHLKLLNIEKTTQKNLSEISIRHIEESPVEMMKIKEKLNKQIKVLRQSYEEGYITKNSYIKCKDRLDGALQKLNK